MKLSFSFLSTSLLSITLSVLIMTQTLAQVPLKTGDKAPDFTSTDQDNQKVTLSQFKGRKVVLYFYPKDDTPGCTAEACNLRDNHTKLLSAGYVVLGVSSDDEVSHKQFREKYSLPFSLLADTDKSIHHKYGVWVEKEKEGKKYFGTARTTFVIDEKGVIIKIIDKVDTGQHSEQILP